jgi:hypothetical protein
LRHLIIGEIRPNGHIGRRAQAAKNKCDPLLLDETASLLDGLGRAVTVVEADEIDFAAVDSAGLVDKLEVGGFGGGRCLRGLAIALPRHNLPRVRITEKPDAPADEAQ